MSYSKTDRALVDVRTVLMLYEDLRLATISNNEREMKLISAAITSVMLGIGVDTLRHIESCLEEVWITELRKEA